MFQSIAPRFAKSSERHLELRLIASLCALALLTLGIACRSDSEAQRVRPRQLRDVPAQRLAFTFSADIEPPANASTEEAKPIQAIQEDFDVRRKDEALVLHRTVTSPDGQRALALYSEQDESSTTFHIDLYASSGTFIRNVTPPDLAVVFQDSVLWSADSGYIAFVARKAAQPQASPTPPGLEEPGPLESPVASPTVMPAFPPLATFSTEQIYICDKDGYALKPLTTRDGLIYFALSWAPDGHALSALACKESEWDAREREFKTPSGRPRLITLDGAERLLDDEMAQAPPVWSPDSAKIATAFDVDIGIYDATDKAPTQARIVLRERMITASAAFDEKGTAKKSPDQSKPNTASTPTSGVPVSFNPIVRMEWPVPEKLYVQTGYLDLRNVLPTFSRWHLLTLSPQAVVLGR
ncbi:MAG TPA: hypothetical protein VN696_02410 [Pyrinomonadaceae bacterium]|nr:hypothetical protein [Pyrinomonadaceae bacterium]